MSPNVFILLRKSHAPATSLQYAACHITCERARFLLCIHMVLNTGPIKYNVVISLNMQYLLKRAIFKYPRNIFGMH
jgi:hypothetical protein